VTVLISSNRIVCANTGDSRAVLCRSSGTVVPLSEDHKPTGPNELRRIEAAGSTVEGGRVNGVLGVSRAIGDFDFKDRPDLPWTDQAVTAKPDITEIEMTRDDSFIVIACDGIWEVLSNEEVCQFVRESLAATNDDVGLVCEMLLDKCLAPVAPGLGCDNMTAVIVKFSPTYFS
jgi:protein phosphatase 2C family protein 2/3